MLVFRCALKLAKVSFGVLPDQAQVAVRQHLRVQTPGGFEAIDRHRSKQVANKTVHTTLK